MINQHLQGPPADIRNGQLQLKRKTPFSEMDVTHCAKFYLTTSKNATERIICYSFHDRIFKNVLEAKNFCKNAFVASSNGELAFGHFPTHENEKLPGKSQIWSYAKPGFLHDIDQFVCSCQSSHNNTFIKLKDSSVCPKAKDSQVFDSKVCPSELNVRTVCALENIRSHRPSKEIEIIGGKVYLG